MAADALYVNINQVADVDVDEDVVDPTPWLFGKLERDEVATLLRQGGLKDGLFIVRESTRNVGDYVLSFAQGGTVQHFAISVKNGKFSLDDGKTNYKSLQDLVERYKLPSSDLIVPLGSWVSRVPPSHPMEPQQDEEENYEVVDQPVRKTESLPRNAGGMLHRSDFNFANKASTLPLKRVGVENPSSFGSPQLPPRNNGFSVGFLPPPLPERNPSFSTRVHPSSDLSSSLPPPLPDRNPSFSNRLRGSCEPAPPPLPDRPPTDRVKDPLPGPSPTRPRNTSDPLPPIPSVNSNSRPPPRPESDSESADDEPYYSMESESPPIARRNASRSAPSEPPHDINDEGGNPYAFSTVPEQAPPPPASNVDLDDPDGGNPYAFSTAPRQDDPPHVDTDTDDPDGGNPYAFSAPLPLPEHSRSSEGSKTDTLPQRRPTANVEVNRLGVAVTANRPGFENLEKVQVWRKKNEEISKTEVKLTNLDDLPKRRDDISLDATRLAEERLEAFKKQAAAEEMMYLFWLNNTLKAVNKSASDLGPSLRDATLIIDALRIVSNKRPPMYVSTPRIELQMRDNWVVVIKYMRSLGIVVDNDPTQQCTVGEGEGEGEGVGLDPNALFELDTREILKLFSKILNFENSLPPRK